MSLQRRISWTAALADIKNDRAKVPAGYGSARAMVECYVKTRRPLVVAGQYDRAAIMAHAVAVAKWHQGHYGSTWGQAMAIALKAAWQVAKTARAKTAH